jgi:hypothetical protein
MKERHGKTGGGDAGKDGGVHAMVAGAGTGRLESDGHVEPPFS